MNRLVFISMVALIFIFIDLYIFQALKFITHNFSGLGKRTLYLVYWGVTLLSLSGFLIYNLGGQESLSRGMRTFFFSLLFINYFPKLFGVVFLLVDDLARAGRWVWGQLGNASLTPVASSNPSEDVISRSEFLVKTSLIATAVPALTMGYGILSGAHDYRIRRVTVTLPNLPASFDGIRIAQISDIHTGSFYNRTAVQGGVDMLLAEKPDMIFFTGDLVNNMAKEVNNYINVFEKVKAPLGVFSTLGNHDYGDYYQWPSMEAKRKNLQNVIQAHQVMGWDLLINEHRMIRQGSDQLAVLGVENWGAGRFAKYGKLNQAYQGSEEAAVKLLLSHDPSHWDAQVRPMHPDIDVMFAGHTHGFQFGIEVGNFKWSPSQYIYKQWAGLYQKDAQYLYVNRGYGYLVFPGRIGILPEITLMELKRA